VDRFLTAIVDSAPVQRLRHISQLALTNLVYPGATHRRFEHSLGVMDLAGRVFDAVTATDRVNDEIRDLLPELTEPEALMYWKRVLQVAALCHDIGHLPFSHAAERELLPDGWDHERLTRELLSSAPLSDMWPKLKPLLNSQDIVKLAIGKKKAPDLEFSNWEAVLSEIVVGDAFGVDRMDYLLRDSHHIGVPYGRFDHNRLIDTLRILPFSPEDPDAPGEPALGVERGGLESAEALLLARYLMYSQVYFHRVRLIYDLHLIDFLRWWIGGHFPIKPDEHQRRTDDDALVALRDAALGGDDVGGALSRRITAREHFRVLYERNPHDLGVNPDAARAVADAAQIEFSEENIKYSNKLDQGGSTQFPVLMRDGRVAASHSVSEALTKLPIVRVEYVYVAPELREEAQQWLQEKREELIQPKEEE